jgi:hypothetical protein
MHIVAPLLVGQTFLIRTGTTLFPTESKFITVSLAADWTGNGKGHFSLREKG